MSNEQRSAYLHSYLFHVRLWLETMSDEEAELRGEVRHVLSGEVRYFRELSALTTYLSDKVHELVSEGRATGRELCRPYEQEVKRNRSIHQ